MTLYSRNVFLVVNLSWQVFCACATSSIPYFFFSLTIVSVKVCEGLVAAHTSNQNSAALLILRLLPAVKMSLRRAACFGLGTVLRCFHELIL